MATKDEAKAVHQAVRAYFKGSLKSSNKVYDLKAAQTFLTEQADEVMLSDGSVQKIEKMSERDRKKKVVSRKTSADLASSLLPKLTRRAKNYSVREYGELVANQHGDREDRVGNCLEMSAMAVTIARRTPAIGTPWLVYITAPGDHAFCAITASGDTAPPAWTTVMEMANDEKKTYIVDPWANTCCLAKVYPRLVVSKFEDWSDQGKRIIKRVTARNEKKVDVLVEPPEYAEYDPHGKDYLRLYRTSKLECYAFDKILIAGPPPAEKKMSRSPSFSRIGASKLSNASDSGGSGGSSASSESDSEDD